MTIEGSSKDDDFNFGTVSATLEINDLSDLGDGFAIGGGIGTSILNSTNIEKITVYSNDDDKLDVSGVFGAGDISMYYFEDASDAIDSADLDSAASQLTGETIYNAAFVSGSADDYLLLRDGGQIYAIKFDGGAGGTIDASSANDLFI